MFYKIWYFFTFGILLSQFGIFLFLVFSGFGIFRVSLINYAAMPYIDKNSSRNSIKANTDFSFNWFLTFLTFPVVMKICMKKYFVCHCFFTIFNSRRLYFGDVVVGMDYAATIWLQNNDGQDIPLNMITGFVSKLNDPLNLWGQSDHDLSILIDSKSYVWDSSLLYTLMYVC